MNKSKSISLKCLGCAGSQKEVTLCHIVDCTLWRYRFGCSPKTQQFKYRMLSAKHRFQKEFPWVREQVLEHLKNMPCNDEFALIRSLYE